jgi:hypothetical protein
MGICTTYDIMWLFIYVHIHVQSQKGQNMPPRILHFVILKERSE